jgi:hypothetical protein
MGDEKNINNLIQDLTQLVQVSDDTVAFWASAALNELTRLRSLTAQHGFVHWSFSNAHLFRADPTLNSALKSALEPLRRLANILENESIRREADSQSEAAASRIYSAFKTFDIAA